MSCPKCSSSTCWAAWAEDNGTSGTYQRVSSQTLGAVKDLARLKWSGRNQNQLLPCTSIVFGCCTVDEDDLPNGIPRGAQPTSQDWREAIRPISWRLYVVSARFRLLLPKAIKCYCNNGWATGIREIVFAAQMQYFEPIETEPDMRSKRVLVK